MSNPPRLECERESEQDLFETSRSDHLAMSSIWSRPTVMASRNGRHRHPLWDWDDSRPTLTDVGVRVA